MIRLRPALAFAMLLPFMAVAATPFDGTYHGGNSPNGPGVRCPAGQSFNIVVKGGAFMWSVAGVREPVTVGPDGSFTGRAGQRFINGKITGNSMTANTTGSECNYAWSLTR